MGILGFDINSGKTGGDFVPIIKYDAKSGQISRIDRAQDSSGAFVSRQVIITKEFKAMVDLENIETGWALFAPGQPPSFAMVRIAAIGKNGVVVPPKPSDKHKNGLRMMLKLAANCGGDRPVRELAGNSTVFNAAWEEVYQEYLNECGKYPGMLPVITMPDTMPIKGQHGTNFKPLWKIIGWTPRGDFQPVARQNGEAQAHAGNGAAPSTGSTRAVPPQQMATVSASDFG